MFFLKEDSFTCFSGDLLVNPDQPRLTIPISQIAPDLILADLPRNIMLNNDELEFEQAPEFLLGNYVYFENKNYDAFFSLQFRKYSNTTNISLYVFSVFIYLI